MLSPELNRRLITAIYSLVVLVVAMFSLLGLLAFLRVSESNVSAPATQTINGAASPTASPAVAALTPAQEHGKTLFSGNCAQCHALSDEVVVGPGLKGVRERTPGDEWLRKWIKNSTALVTSGDAYAVQVYNKYQKIPMASFTNLSDQDLTDLIDYLGTAK